jgi:hypothetical protein
MLTFADRGCRVVSATDPLRPYSRFSGQILHSHSRENLKPCLKLVRRSLMAFYQLQTLLTGAERGKVRLTPTKQLVTLSSSVLKVAV